MLDEKDVNTPETVPQEGVEETASPAEVEETQEPEVTETETPQKIEEPEVTEEQRVPYDRFKDVVEEKNYYKELLAKQMQAPVAQPQEASKDKYGHLAPEEQVFYRNQESMMKQVAKEIVEEKEKKLQTQMQFLQQRDAQRAVESFRSSHPDVKTGSFEENEIASKIKIGYQPDDAYWSVMGPRGIKNAQQTAQTKVKQQMQVKKKANVEHSGVQTSGLPTTERSYRDDLASEEFEIT